MAFPEGDIKQLFLRCFAADSHERAAILAEVERDSPTVAQELRSLLELSEKDHLVDHALDLPADGVADTEPETCHGTATDHREPRPTEFGQIGPYSLIEKIGEGGMGIVFRASQTSPIRRQVALKLIKPGMDSEQILARFEAERHVLSLLDHPSIARVLDAGETALGRPYFVLELVDGCSLTEYCQRAQLGLEQRLRLFLEVCDGVQHAHLRGIIHRDLKPSNLMVYENDGSPVVKIIDFGIAKSVAPDPSHATLTHHLQLVGTPAYMSPEQADLQNRDIDIRSDIYSLGMVLYELLAGSIPYDSHRFRRATFEQKCRMIREDEPLPPSEWLKASESSREDSTGGEKMRTTSLRRSEVKGELDWIVLKALGKDREFRYESARVFAEDIRRFLAGSAVQAGPPSRLYRLRKSIRKHRAAVAGGLACFLLLVIGISGTLWQWRLASMNAEKATRLAIRESGLRSELQVTLDKVRKQSQAIQEENHRAERLLYANQLKVADYEWDFGSPLLAASALRRVNSELRGPEYYLLHDTIHSAHVATGRGHTDEVQSVLPSPNGREFASISADNTLRIWELKTGNQLHCIELEDHALEICYLPDGTQIAVASPRSVHLVDIEAGRSQPVCEVSGTPANLTGRGTGNLLAFTVAGRELQVFDTKASETVAQWTTEPMESVLLRFGDDENKLVQYRADRKVVVWDMRSGGIERTEEYASLSQQEPGDGNASSVKRVPEPVLGLAIQQRNGLAFSWTQHDLRLWSYPGWELIIEASPLRAFGSAAVSPGGGRVITGSKDGVVRVPLTREDGIPTRLGLHERAVSSVAFSNDGVFVISGSLDHTVKVWNARPPTLHPQIPTELKPAAKAVMSDDERRIATAGSGGTIQILGTKPLQFKGVLDTGYVRVHDLSFQQNSQLLGCCSLRSEKVAFWDVESRTELRSIQCPGKRVTGLSFQPVGTQVAIATTGEVEIWDFPERVKRRELKPPEKGILAVGYSRDGKLLAAASARKIAVWSTSNWERVHVFDVPSGLFKRLCFSADGTRLACGDRRSEEIRIFELASGQQLQQLRVPNERFTSMAFDPRSDRLITGSLNGVVRVWDPSIGLCLATFTAAEDAVNAILIPKQDGVILTANKTSYTTFNYTAWESNANQDQ